MAQISNESKIQEFVDAGQVRTYYEVEGSGDPLLLLHGGSCPIETFSALAGARRTSKARLRTTLWPQT